MKIKPYLKPEGFGMTMAFNEQDVPVVRDMLQVYYEKHSQEMEKTQWLSYIMCAYLATSDNNNLPLKVNLQSAEYPIFINEMVKVSAEYLVDDLLEFRQVLTPRPPEWLQVVCEAPNDSDTDELAGQFADSQLAVFDKNLEHADLLALNFAYLASLTNGT